MRFVFVKWCVLCF